MFAFLFAIFVLMATLCPVSSNQNFDAGLVTDFFKIKSIHFGYVFNCFPSKERIIITKFLMKSHLRISVNNIKHYNLALVKKKYPTFQHSGIIIDGDCANVENFLKEAGELMLFDDTHHWLILSSNETILTKLFNLAFNINTDLYVATPTINNDEKSQNWTITDVYNPAYQHGGELIVDNIGFYNKKQGFEIENKENKYWKRRNMTGVNLKSMTVLRQPFGNKTLDEYLQNDEDRRADPFVRFHCKLIYYCKEFYNFSLEVSMTKTWGYEISKGKFDGMAGALQRKEIDFGCVGLYIKPERIPVIDFAIGLWYFRTALMFRQPTIRSFGQVFLHPMSTSVWLATIAAALLIIVTLKLNQKFEFRILNTVQCTLDHTWSTIIIFTLGAFCQQGSPQSPILICGRIITISILLFCLLFYQFYSGSIVSSLLTKPPIAIKNPHDLLKSSLEVGSDGVPYMKDYFRTTKDPVAIALYEKKIRGQGNSTRYYKPEYGLKLVQKGGFAYNVEKTTAYIIIQETFSDKAICELGEVELFPKNTVMSALSKNSPFRDMLNYCMQRLAEHGIGEYQKAHWGARKPECWQSSHSMIFEVGLREIYPAIVLLCIGILISLVVLGLEVFMKKRSEKGDNKKKKTATIPYPFIN